MSNRNPWYKVYVGDDLRLGKALSTEAYGLYGILRNWVHDAIPYGHLVDPRGVPLTDEQLIDISGLRASNFRAAWQDLLALRAIRPATEWLAEVAAKEHANFVAIAQELVCGVSHVTAFRSAHREVQRTKADPLILPALANQWVRTMFGKRSALRRDLKDRPSGPEGGPQVPPEGGRQGGPQVPPQGGRQGGPQVPPQGGRQGGPQAHSHDHDNDHEHDYEFAFPVLTPVRERERFSTTRAREAPDEKPMSWSAYRTHCMRVAAWQKRIDAQHPDGIAPDKYATLYEAEFHESLSAWEWMKNRMERAIPAPCGDGHHVYDGAFCRYCPDERSDAFDEVTT
jgi:hypothetical protein